MKASHVIVAQSIVILSLSVFIHDLLLERDFYKKSFLVTAGLAEKAILQADHFKEVSQDFQAELQVLKLKALKEKMANYIRTKNKRTPAKAIAEAILFNAQEKGLNPLDILAQIEQESTFNPEARGLAHECGLMQIHPATATTLALPWTQCTDIALNIDAGTTYMARHLKTYGTVSKALLRFNGGGDPDYLAHWSRRRASIVAFGL